MFREIFEIIKILFYAYLIYFILSFLYVLAIHQPFVLPRNKDEEERLNELIRRGDLLVTYCYKNLYPSEEIANRIYKNWNILKENKKIGLTPEDTDTPGFVINKNDSMQLCVTKNPKGGELDELNLATFVLIHEISHLGAEEYQHGHEFLSVFKKLLRASMDIGIWNYQDYKKNPQTYCEYYVNATPQIDKFLNYTESLDFLFS